MAQVEIRVAGRTYEIACRDGEEARLATLGELVDEKAIAAGRTLGGINEARQLVLAALLLADELTELRFKAAAAESPWTGIAPLLEEIAERLEGVATRLDDGLEPEARTP